MNLASIKTLIAAGESTTLELKTSTSELGKACQTICAMLNTHGGTVIMGVKNNKELVGQHVTDNTRLEIANHIKKIEPPAQSELIVEYLPYGDDKHLIVIEVAKGKHAPYVYDGRPYARLQSTTSVMTQHGYEQLLVQRGQLNHDWDAGTNTDYGLSDLDHEEIRRTVKEGVDANRIGVEVLQDDVRQILQTLALMQEDQLTNAAMVLYAKKAEKDYQQCMIRLARFKGLDNLGDFIDNQRVYGNAFKIIAAAIEFANRYLPIASYFEESHMQRRDQPAVPPLALREALVNAVSHRDYSKSNATLSLAIYDDRLEIWNNGDLAPELTLDDLRKRHASYPRNKTIATVFYKRGWVEGWGTGTTRMISYCQKNGTPEPEYAEYSSGFAVIFRFKETMHEEKIANAAQKLDLTPRQQKILALLGGTETLSVNALYDLLEGTVAKRTVQGDLYTLHEQGLVQQIGKGRAAVWKVKPS